MKKLMKLATTAGVASFLVATTLMTSGCGPTQSEDGLDGGDSSAACRSDPDNCVCSQREDCGGLEWACTSSHQCMRICSADSECAERNPADTCVEGLCLPPECGSEVRCAEGEQCVEGACQPALFREQFDAILDHLVSDFWSPDGDWSGDMQGDATAFAPKILYAVGDARMIDMATTTVDLEVRLGEAAATTGNITMEAVIGVPALADGYRNTGKSLYRSGLLLAARQGYTMMRNDPDAVAEFVGSRATVYGSGAYVSFEAYEISGEQEDLDHALDLIDQANLAEWDEARGFYRADYIDWPQATMIMALSKAYRVTKDPTYLAYAKRALAFMDAHCWDEVRGGYNAYEDGEAKTLSGNNNMVWALLDLYEATEDAAYLTRAQATLTWMFSEALYAHSRRILVHDWLPEGPSDFFCTGCNFHTLCNIHRLNALLARRKEH